MKARLKRSSLGTDKQQSSTSESVFKSSLDPSKWLDFQNTISALSSENQRLQLENHFLKEQRRAAIAKELELTDYIKKLKETSCPSPIPAQLQLKIDSNYTQLMKTVGNLQMSLREKVQGREEEIRKTFEAKLQHKVEEATLKMAKQSDAALERRVNELSLQVESLTSQLFYYEAVTNTLVKENQLLTSKAAAAKAERDTFLADMKTKAASNVVSLQSSPGCKPKTLAKPRRGFASLNTLPEISTFKLVKSSH